MRFSTWLLLGVTTSTFCVLTHTRTRLTALVDTKKKRAGALEESNGYLRRTNSRVHGCKLQGSAPPMMDALLLKSAWGLTPGLPKQANKGTLNSH